MNSHRSMGPFATQRVSRAGMSRLLLLAAGASAVTVFAACGSSGGNNYGGEDGGPGAGSSGGQSSSGGKSSSSGGTSSGGQSSSGGSSGGKGSSSGGFTGDGGVTPPPETNPTPVCNPSTTEGTASTITFDNNLMPSPAPPGNLTPQNAPQIVVFGWDDVESLAGLQFVTQLLGSVQNPAPNPNTNTGTNTQDQSATANLNANACYAYDSAYSCGDGTLASNRGVVTSLVTTNGFAMANHTIDHLENYEPNATWWSLIPTSFATQWQDTTNGGWKGCITGPSVGICSGPACCMDSDTWNAILPLNETALVNDYSLPSGYAINGFRAPRLEMNDLGLQALQGRHYSYDESLEEVQPAGVVSAAVDADTDTQQGLNWIPWPYTLDNGSPGIWNQQAGGSQQWITNFPTGLWEAPTYEVYVPSANGLGTAIANTMLAADNPATCPFPPGTPADQEMHCFLSPGELSPGDAETEITGFDFNTFIYCRMTPDQWLTVMKHTFLLRYYGNRTPLTYGSHPIEYTAPYDSYTLETQANNYGYRDVINDSTYATRQTAMTQFVQWIKSDPNFSKDTYFMSTQDLVTYMQHPFDKTGAVVQQDTIASPDSNGLFSRVGFTASSGAQFTANGGNSATITFTLPALDAAGDTPDVVYAQGVLAAGSLQNLSHIDIKYNTQLPFRIRLLTSDGSSSVTALLAGVGGERTARIRIKDFFPGPEASESQVLGASLVDSSYMAKVTGIAFESAATTAAPSGTPGSFAGGTFTTNIEQITFHGATTAALCSP